MSNNSLKLYKTINLAELTEKAGFEKEPPRLNYNDGNDEKKIIDLRTSNFERIMINDFEKNWTPERHNLTLNQKFMFSNPSYLYGSSGITSQENILSIGLHIHSRSSNFQKTFEIGEISKESSVQELYVEEEFEAGSLRGIIELDYFIFLKKVNMTHNFHADVEGTKLTTEFIESYSIGVDGSGSEFPMLEVNEPKKALWWLEFNYEDVYQDEFDTSNIILYLNQGHPEFETLSYRRRTIDQFYMKSIIVEAMMTITTQVLLIDGTTIDNKNMGENGSIAKVIWYWISTFNIETDSLVSIQRSFHELLNGKGGKRE